MQKKRLFFSCAGCPADEGGYAATGATRCQMSSVSVLLKGDRPLVVPDKQTVPNNDNKNVRHGERESMLFRPDRQGTRPSTSV